MLTKPSLISSPLKQPITRHRILTSRQEPDALRRVKRGDLWQLGSHRLLCGDCTDAGQVARLMDGERASLTITSPPYNIGKRSFPHTGKSQTLAQKYLYFPDKLPEQQYLHLLTAFTDNALEVSEVVIVNLQQLSGNKVAVTEYLYHFRKHLIDVAIWDKDSTRPVITRNVLK